jgi:hypothetical protein
MPRARSGPEKELQVIPGIGPSIARDLVELGVRRVADLRGREPERMYEQLCATRGVHQDRCLLYVFRCAVYYASHRHHEPELLQWWNWSDANLAAKRRRRRQR